MRFKTGQQVRIKGTQIEGTYQGTNGYGIPHVEGTYANGLPDYYVPAELIEAVIEPITVTFDPVELPATVDSSLTTIEVNGKDGWVNLESEGRFGGGPLVRSLRHENARKLAYAILTITDGDPK